MRINLKLSILFGFIFIVVASTTALFVVIDSFREQSLKHMEVEATKKTRIIANLIAPSMQVGDYNEVANVVSHLLRDQIISSVHVENQFGDVVVDKSKGNDSTIKMAEPIVSGVNDAMFGAVTIGYELSYFKILADHFKNKIILIMLVVLFLIAVVGFVIIRYLQSVVYTFGDGLKSLTEDKEHFINSKSAFSDVEGLARWFNETSKKVSDSRRLEVERARLDAFASLATQVSHDIRSPLSALNMAVSVPDSPDRTQLIQLAIARIDEVASELLRKYKSTETKPELLDPLISEIVNEKKLQFTKGPKLEFNLEGSTSQIVAKVNKGQFQRVISNLLNNAIESVKENGVVRVYLSDGSGRVEVRLTDNGCGIPSEVLSRIGSKGVSYNKSGGAGLGLHYAIECVKKWNGSLDIESQETVGTEIRISLPRHV